MGLKNTLVVEKTTVLAVDDDPVCMRLLNSMLGSDQYRVLQASNGIEALKILENNIDKIDLILLDRLMPKMDGLEFCRKIKSDKRFRIIPVIMQTSAGRPEEIKEGIDAGVFYYLVKPLVPETLLSIVESARRKVLRYRYHRSEFLRRKESLGLVDSLQCTFQSQQEGETLAPLLAQLFPQPDLAVIGISELLTNAVEHGNLDIDYALKGVLIRENQLQDEIKKRIMDPQYCDRWVGVSFTKNSEGFYLEVSDEGRGFNWKKYLVVDSQRATDNHGRGIAMANMLSFDKLTYNDVGNSVTAFVSIAQPE